MSMIHRGVGQAESPQRASIGAHSRRGRAGAAVHPGTNLARVLEAIREMAMGSVDHVVDVAGTTIAERTGLKPNQVHDAVFVLGSRGLIEKQRAGARFRLMRLRYTGEATAPASATEDDPFDVARTTCPSCRRRFRLVDVDRAKLEEVDRLIAEYRRVRSRISKRVKVWERLEKLP